MTRLIKRVLYRFKFFHFHIPCQPVLIVINSAHFIILCYGFLLNRRIITIFNKFYLCWFNKQIFKHTFLFISFPSLLLFSIPLLYPTFLVVLASLFSISLHPLYFFSFSHVSVSLYVRTNLLSLLIHFVSLHTFLLPLLIKLICLFLP